MTLINHVSNLNVSLKSSLYSTLLSISKDIWSKNMELVCLLVTRRMHAEYKQTLNLRGVV